MELNRRIRVRMAVILLLLGRVATAFAPPGDSVDTGLSLDCTNDFEELISCQLERQNCTGYSLMIRSNNYPDESNCTMEQCGIGRCCCSVQMLLIPGESHTVTVWKGGQNLESKHVEVDESGKPKTPTNISVKESSGRFEVMWNPNMKKVVRDTLTANLTYYKKGDTVKVSKSFKPATVGGLSYYEISGELLEPNTAYMVSVRSRSEETGKFSDSSEEFEFMTPPSAVSPFLAIIITLSIAAVIFSGAIYYCYVKFKTKCWDTGFKYPNPKLLNMHPSEPELLKPVPAIISSVCVNPLIPDESKPWSKMSLTDTSSGSLQQSSGISTASSCLSYANTEPADIKAVVQDALCKALPNISPISPLTTSLFMDFKDSGLFSAPFNPCGVRAEDSSGSSCFDNKTYSILIPSCQHQIMANTSEVQLQAELPCDSAYHPSESDTVNCPEQQVPACLVPAQLDAFVLPMASSLVPTDMSYQQCNADSGTFSYAEDSNLSYSSSGSNTTTSCDLVSRVEPGCESSNEVVSGATKLNGQSEEAIVCDNNPCYGCVPAEALQNLVEQPDVWLSDQRSGELEEHLDKDSCTKVPQSLLSPVVPAFMNKAQNGQCPSEVQAPFLCLMSADKCMPVITDSGYQSV